MPFLGHSQESKVWISYNGGNAANSFNKGTFQLSLLQLDSINSIEPVVTVAYKLTAVNDNRRANFECDLLLCRCSSIHSIVHPSRSLIKDVLHPVRYNSRSLAYRCMQSWDCARVTQSWDCSENAQCNLKILRLHGTHTHTQHMYTHMLTATHTLLETCNHWPNRHAGCPSCIFYNLVHQSFGSPEKKEESKECFSHSKNIVALLPEVHSKSVFGSFILKQNGKGLGDFIMWVTSAFTSGRRRQERRGESLKVYETLICSAHPKTKSWSSCNTSNRRSGHQATLVSRPPPSWVLIACSM